LAFIAVEHGEADVPNQFGAYDLGGIELHDPDSIFQDRFED